LKDSYAFITRHPASQTTYPGDTGGDKSGRDSKEAIKLASDILALADKKRKEHLAVRHF
jgi:hypothetical protein